MSREESEGGEVRRLGFQPVSISRSEGRDRSASLLALWNTAIAHPLLPIYPCNRFVSILGADHFTNLFASTTAADSLEVDLWKIDSV